jgi:hypothetical protein
MPNIAIVWDFDGTLTPEDSTTKVVETLQGPGKGGPFWDYIKSIRGDKHLPKWEHILAMDTPIWMYSLSRLAVQKKVPLNREFFHAFVLPQIELYPGVKKFLLALKELENQPEFQKLDLKVHHFIVTAGLKELVELVFSDGLMTWTFGCRYAVVIDKEHPAEPESIPVFCMDETVKTRSLFEISKGAFCNKEIEVNTWVDASKYWAPFNNFIYIGDADTDVPAFSLVRSKGGLGVVVYNPSKSRSDIRERHRKLRLDKRADLITPADFSLEGELFSFIRTRCIQIRQRYEAAVSEVA